MNSKEYERLLIVVDAEIREAVREAIEEHRRAGRSIFVWRDGKVVEIPAHEIPAAKKAGESEPPPYGGKPKP